MITVKEIREILVDNSVTDTKNLAKLTDDEILEKYRSNCKDDGEVMIDGVIYLPRGGSFENYWRRVDDGTDDDCREWVLDLPGHENDGARLIIYPLRFAPDEYIVEIKCKDESDNNLFYGFSEAMEDIVDSMNKFVNIW